MALSTLANLKHDLECICGEDLLASFAWTAAREQVVRMVNCGKTDLTNRLSIGEDDPNSLDAIADFSLTVEEFLVQSNSESPQAKSARARLIVFTYTLWETVYRPSISKECRGERIVHDAFGDLRHYRNAILHNKGYLQVETKVLKTFCRGDLVEPTGGQLREIFKQLVLALNDIAVQYYQVHPRFEWGYRLNS